MTSIARYSMLGCLCIILTMVSDGFAAPHNDRDATDSTIPSVEKRFASATEEVPDFQKHITPLLGRLGCNGRACHGSFQGQGGFQLSLFGYDFKSDHAALMSDGTGRVDLDDTTESLILVKPTDADMHDGGLRYEADSWQYNVLKQWIDGGARSAKSPARLAELKVVPNEIFVRDKKPTQLRVIAVWQDGTREDVTPLCRFKVNNTSIANVSETGVVTPADAFGDTYVVAFYDNAVSPVPVVAPLAGDPAVNHVLGKTRVDQLVLDKLNKLGIKRSEVVDDVAFLRRVSLDIAGTLPTPDEVCEFIINTNSDKRRQKIEELLESPAYSAWWSTFFCDLTGNNSRQLRNLGVNQDRASLQWYKWFQDKIQRNVPYDEMMEGIVLATSRQPDEPYIEYCERMSDSARDAQAKGFAEGDSMPYYWMRREFQDQDTRAISFAHAFMGVRIQCAQCHKHPFDQWSQDDFQQFSRFFTGVSTQQPQRGSKQRRNQVAKMLKDIGIDPTKTRGGMLQRALVAALRKGETIPFVELQVHGARQDLKREDRRNPKKRNQFFEEAVLLGSAPIDLTQFEDVRQPVMEWLRQPDNPYFARAIVNRIWAYYFGVGIVEPADDLNLANPPSNGPLLDYLAKSFVENGYDLKWLHREITSSDTYQLSWKSNETNRNDRRNFSRALPRRLPAEVVYDAARQAASNQSMNASFRESVGGRAISIPGTNLNYRRNREGASSAFAMTVFGRSDRDSSCDCDRSSDTSLIQTVYLQNDRDIHAMLTGRESWLREIAGSGKLDQDKQRMATTQQHVARLKRVLEENEQRGDQKRVKNLRKQLRTQTQLVQQLKRRVSVTQGDPIRLTNEQFVNDAYLRTLSRFPNETELQRCLEHIQQDKDEINGRIGVMWALINTKEFVVNH